METKGQLSFQEGYFPKVRLRLLGSLADAPLARVAGEESLRDEPEHLRERLDFDET